MVRQFCSVTALPAVAAIFLVAISVRPAAAQLSFEQQRELLVFGMTSGLGLEATVDDIKKRWLSRQEVNQMVALGIDGKGVACARVLNIHPLREENQYEVTCMGGGVGSVRKTYVLDLKSGEIREE